MKRMFLFVIALAMTMMMVACAGKEEADSQPEDGTDISSMVGMPNPIQEYESLAEINDVIGCQLVHPPVMGVTDEMFCVIGGTLAQYQLKINGVEYTFRASRAQDDITGVYVECGTLSDRLADVAEGTAINTAGYNVARWFAGDMQYAITSQDRAGEMLETFQTFVDEARTLQG